MYPKGASPSIVQVSPRVARLDFGDLRIEGWSRAGDETWIRIHPPGLALDVGRGAPRLAGAGDLFLTHGHLDHALGVPFVLSQRSLYELPPTRVICPHQIAQQLGDLIEAAAKLEERTYNYHLIPLAAGDRLAVGRNLMVEAFPTDHVVPSLGFHLIRRKHRLMAAFLGKSPEELISLRRRKVRIEEEIEELWVSYCGDTGPKVFELEPRICRSAVLLLECTFLEPEEMERARYYKHLHLHDLVARAGEIDNRELVLCHLSRRHGKDRILEEVTRQLPRLRSRVHLLM